MTYVYGQLNLPNTISRCIFALDVNRNRELGRVEKLEERKMLRPLSFLSIIMGVASGADLQVKERPRDQQLETMQKLTLKCAIVGAQTVNFRWTYQADDDPPRVLKDEDSSIVIKNVS